MKNIKNCTKELKNILFWLVFTFINIIIMKMQQLNLLYEVFSQYYYLYAILSILVLLYTGKKVFIYLTCVGYD